MVGASTAAGVKRPAKKANGGTDAVVDASPEERRTRDATAPIDGAKLTPYKIGDLLEHLSKADREKAANRLVDANPELRKARREKVRAVLTMVLLAAVFIDAAAALVLAMSHAISWDELRDWLTLALVPLTPGVAVALAFWFPTKETE